MYRAITRWDRGGWKQRRRRWISLSCVFVGVPCISTVNEPGIVSRRRPSLVTTDGRPQRQRRNVCFSHISIFLSGLGKWRNIHIYMWASLCVFGLFSWIIRAHKATLWDRYTPSPLASFTRFSLSQQKKNENEKIHTGWSATEYRLYASLKPLSLLAPALWSSNINSKDN